MSEVKKRAVEPKFFKADILRSKRFADKRDVIDAALEEGKGYTLSQVEKIIKTFLSKEVK